MLLIISTSAISSSLYESAINHDKRLKSDFQYDDMRLPAKVLPFTQILEGDKVLELGAGGGYTTELLSWTVGESGKIYSHFLYNKERLSDGRLSNVIPLRNHSLLDHQEVLNELPIHENELDAVVIFFVLHDIYLNNEMSNELLATLYKSLKPGGRLIIMDNAAKVGSGIKNIGDLHRIDESFVKSTMIEAGFEFDKSVNALRNTQDDHTKPWGDFKGFQDRFGFRFLKPVN